MASCRGSINFFKAGHLCLSKYQIDNEKQTKESKANETKT